MKTQLIVGFMVLALPALAKSCGGALKEASPSELTLASDESVAQLKPFPDTIPQNRPVQDTSFKKIRVHFKPNGQYHDRIEFWQEGQEQPVEIVDLETFHPFNGLPFKIIGRAYGSDQYDLSGVSQSEMERHFGKWEVPPSITDTTVIGADGQLQVGSDPTMKEYTVVTYQLYLTNRYREVLAIIADYIVFNCKGDITGRFRTNTAGSPPVVTQDGKYVAVKYGGFYGEEGGEYLPEGIKIYNAQSGEIVIDYPIEPIWGNFFLFPAQNYVVLADSWRGKEKKFMVNLRIIDVEAWKIYKKTFPMQRQPNWLNDTDYGPDYVIYYLDDQRQLPAKAFFEKDFNIVDLKN